MWVRRGIECGDVRETFGGDPARESVEVNGLGAAFCNEPLVENWPMKSLFPVENVERKGNQGV